MFKLLMAGRRRTVKLRALGVQPLPFMGLASTFTLRGYIAVTSAWIGLKCLSLATQKRRGNKSHPFCVQPKSGPAAARLLLQDLLRHQMD